MGVSLDSSSIRELATTIAAEVIQALSESRIPTLQIDERDVVEVGPLTIDLARREAVLQGRALYLKPRELNLLAALARNAGRALSREQLLDLAWDDAALQRIDSERTVDVHVRRLRVQLGESAGMLRTVARVGYRLDRP
jgi:DNA-binding response OmpR family regulator